MRFFNDIKNTHGVAVMKFFKQWAKFNSRLASLHNRRIFLLRCRSAGIKPNHLTNSIKGIDSLLADSHGIIRNQVNRYNNRLVDNLLNLEISITVDNIRRSESEIVKIKQQLTNIMSEIVVENFQRKMEINYKKKFYRIKETNISKFRRLESARKDLIKVQENWFKNISGISIPEDVRTFLSLGPKFNITPKKSDLNLGSLLADVEGLVSVSPPEMRNILTSKVVNVVTNYVHSRDTTYDPIRIMMMNTKSFLRAHQELLVTRSDKGNVSVIMKKSDYIDLSRELLTDEEHYQVLTRDPTSTIQQKSNKLMIKVRRKIGDDSGIIKKHTIYNSKVPKFYGLPKVHKPQLALRPIISSLDAPTSCISQYVTDLLTISYNRDNEFYVPDSFSFSDFINNFKCPPDFVLVSLDVVSLFTNIPFELVELSVVRHWNEISRHTQMSQNDLLELVRFIFDNTYFTYQGRYYRQTLGAPMGGKLSPILAQYVLDDLLTSVLPGLPFVMPFLKKYVDDLICMIPEGSLATVLEHFNSYNTHLQFTAEEEVDNPIPFLDIRVIRMGEVLRTDWYNKPSSSGRYLHYRSCHPQNMKLNLVTQMKTRVLRLTHPTFHSQCIVKLKKLFVMNGYPIKLLNKLLCNTSSSPPVEVTMSLNTDAMIDRADIVYATIPYIPVLSNKISLIFKDYKNIMIVKTMKHPLFKNPITIKDYS
ncbi:uncharacterized protein LOC123673297 [Harmonia axyridis]|uniref:uncharacterized protein LOC123673297 n=1 Tax=Harmonia axyridis TaxID=115357 RepID=UPI001E275F95|nr:uncharacterized protein LOC123673297 [Harmonia axyridis]